MDVTTVDAIRGMTVEVKTTDINKRVYELGLSLMSLQNLEPSEKDTLVEGALKVDKASKDAVIKTFDLAFVSDQIMKIGYWSAAEGVSTDGAENTYIGNCLDAEDADSISRIKVKFSGDGEISSGPVNIGLYKRGNEIPEMEVKYTIPDTDISGKVLSPPVAEITYRFKEFGIDGANDPLIVTYSEHKDKFL